MQDYLHVLPSLPVQRLEHRCTCTLVGRDDSKKLLVMYFTHRYHEAPSRIMGRSARLFSHDSCPSNAIRLGPHSILYRHCSHTRVVERLLLRCTRGDEQIFFYDKFNRLGTGSLYDRNMSIIFIRNMQGGRLLIFLPTNTEMIVFSEPLITFIFG